MPLGLSLLEDEGKVFDCLVKPPTLKHVATIGDNDDDYDADDDDECNDYDDNGDSVIFNDFDCPARRFPKLKLVVGSMAKPNMSLGQEWDGLQTWR